MRVRLGLALGLFLLPSAAAALSPGHRWRIYRAEADDKAEVCYPADLLHVRHDEHSWSNTWLMGPDDAEVIVQSRSDKYTTLSEEMKNSIEIDTSPGYPPPEFIGDEPKADYKVIFKITRRIVKPDWYLYTGENKKFILYVWRHRVDHAFKGFWMVYPKSNAAAWKGIPERLRACFKSLGPITNPNWR